MATYIGMTMPMSAFNLVSWLKHPYKGNHAEVAVGKVGKREEPKYFSVVICFIAFLANDLYGFSSWQRIQKRQQNDECGG